MLSVQNTHLMAEHHDFDVLVGLGSNGAPDEAEETAQTHVTNPCKGERRPRRMMVECRGVVPVQRPDRIFGVLQSSSPIFEVSAASALVRE
jgi:hypothetical protein